MTLTQLILVTLSYIIQFIISVIQEEKSRACEDIFNYRQLLRKKQKNKL